VWSLCNDSVSEWCMVRCIAISTCCGQRLLDKGRAHFHTLVRRSSRLSDLPYGFTPHHHGLTRRRIPYADNSRTRSPIVPAASFRWGAVRRLSRARLAPLSRASSLDRSSPMAMSTNRNAFSPPLCRRSIACSCLNRKPLLYSSVSSVCRPSDKLPFHKYI
jgi:hypothetical protein